MSLLSKKIYSQGHFKFVIFAVEDVDVEEPDELDRFDILPSQQLNGNEPEIDTEETQPLTNIRN